MTVLSAFSLFDDSDDVRETLNTALGFSTPTVSTILGKRVALPAGLSLTVNVPAQASTIAAALTAIAGWTWPATSSVTIKLADGTYTMGAGLSVNHPSSATLYLIGNTTTPVNCKLQTAAGITLFYVGAGQSLYANGFEVSHTNQSAWANSCAFLADEGGYIHLGANMVVDRFYWNLFARRGGSAIRAEPGGIFKRSGDTNALAYMGGHITVASCQLLNASDPATALGSSAVNEGGSLDVTGAILNGSKRAGLHHIEGYTRAGSTQFNANVGSGILSEGGGFLDLTSGCAAGGNGRFGAEGKLQNTYGIGGLAQGGAGANTLGLYQPYVDPIFDTLPGSRVTSPNTNESYRIDAKGSGGVYLGNGTGRLFDVSDTARSTKALGLPSIAAGSVPTPDTGFVNFFANPADGNKLYAKNSAGTVTAV